MSDPNQPFTQAPASSPASVKDSDRAFNGPQAGWEGSIPDPAIRKRALVTVALTLFLDLAGFGMILPVLPYFAEHYGASPIEVTLLSTIFSAAQFVMAPVLGKMSDRNGRRPVMLISIAGSVAAGIVLGFATALWIIFVARLVAGVSKANISTAHAYVADVVAPHERAKYMGLMGACIGMGFIFGPTIGGLLSSESMPTLPFFASAALSAINWLMAWRWLPETRTKGQRDKQRQDIRDGNSSEIDSAAIDSKKEVSQGPAGQWRRLLQAKHLRGSLILDLLVINFGFFVAFAMMETTSALYNERMFGWGAKETGLYLTYVGVVVAVFQGVLVGKIARCLGESVGLILGLVSLALGLALTGSLHWLLPWMGSSLVNYDSISVLALVMMLLGGLGIAGGNGLVMSNSSALVSLASTPDQQGYNMGLRESAAALGRITGPVFAGPLFVWLAPGAPMLVAAGVTALTVVLALVLHRKFSQQVRGRVSVQTELHPHRR